MRIGFISYWSCPLARPGVLTSGGMNVYILQLVHALSKQGHTIDIFTRSHKGIEHSITSLSKRVRVVHLLQEKKDLEKDVSIFSKKVEKYMKSENISYDLFYAHYYFSGLVASKLKQSSGIPFVITFHTLGLLKKRYFGHLDEKRILLEKKIIPSLDRCIVSTAEEKKDLENLYHLEGSKIDVVAPGVNHRIFHPRNKLKSRKKLDLPINKKIIVFVGRIDPIKGIHFLIESIAYLARKNKDYENKYQVLIIGGDVQSRSFALNKEVISIKQLILDKKLDCCIRFISSQPHSKLPDYYSASDMVIMPSVYESFGMVVLEAMATGVPVVATRVGGLKYLIKDRQNGRLFESKNIVQLATIIDEISHNEKEQLRLGKNAVSYSWKYCWEKQSEMFIKAFKKVIKK